MDKNLYVILMAGGVGTRFWPYSRNAKPKQFLDVLGVGKTLLQSTYERYLPICLPENIWVVTHEEHAGVVREQLPIAHDDQILAEPMRKNTAPCIAYAANKIFLKNPNAVMIVSPSDHLILSEKEFLQTIQKAVDQAKSQDKLITLGIKPTRPETGYGYIQFLESKAPLKKVKTFTEKPAIPLAKTFIESGDFVWNSGVFVWGVKAILQAFHRYLPEMAEAFEEIRPQLNSPDEKMAVSQIYGQTKNISIDYGVMEKADNVYVALGNFSWSDLGSWASLYEASDKDAHNNVVGGNALVYDTRNSVIKGPDDKLLVVQGLNGFLVGIFDNVVIVCEKDKEELFRRYVNDLKSKQNGTDYL
jgi:mannose-1-phosphate guanylyltransferase